MEYSLDVKNARLEVTRDLLDGGSLEILSDTGMRIVSMQLDDVSGVVRFGSLIFNGFPKFAMAENKGHAAIAQLKCKAGEVKARALTVGASNADIVMGNVDIDTANVVKIERAEIKHA